MQETGRYDVQTVVARYKRAIALSASWEAGYYRLGQYADDCIQQSPNRILNALPGSVDDKKKYMDIVMRPEISLIGDCSDLLLANSTLCVKNFAKALRFGTKFLYQALPRMVTIWLDLGAEPECVRYELAERAGNMQASKSRRTSAIKMDAAQPNIIKMYVELSGYVAKSCERLPWYMVCASSSTSQCPQRA